MCWLQHWRGNLPTQPTSLLSIKSNVLEGNDVCCRSSCNVDLTTVPARISELMNSLQAWR